MAVTCPKNQPLSLSNNPLPLPEMETSSTETAFNGLDEEYSPEEGRWDFNLSEIKNSNYHEWQRYLAE